MFTNPKSDKRKFTVTELGHELYENDYSKDVEFLVGSAKTEIKAHKSVLSAISPVFKNMFYSSGMKESTELVAKIEIPDIEPNIMKELIKCCYYREVPSLPIEQLFLLIIAADKYNIVNLENERIKYVISCIAKENCTKILALALPLPFCKSIEVSAYDFIIMSEEAYKLEGIFNVLPKDKFIEISLIMRRKELINTLLDRIIEYIEFHKIAEEKEIKEFLLEFVKNFRIIRFLSNNINALIKYGILDYCC